MRGKERINRLEEGQYKWKTKREEERLEDGVSRTRLGGGRRQEGAGRGGEGRGGEREGGGEGLDGRDKRREINHGRDKAQTRIDFD